MLAPSSGLNLAVASRSEWRPGLGFLAFCLLFCVVHAAYPRDLILLDSQYFLPLHTAFETASLILASLAFALLWRVPESVRHAGLMVFASALVGAAALDFGHMLSYKGMPDLVTPAAPEKSIAFWLLGRAWMTAGLLAVAAMPTTVQSGTLSRALTLAVSLALAMGGYALVLWWPELLPRTYVEGSGLTPLKVGFEWALVAALALAGWRLAATARELRSLPMSMLAMGAGFAAVGELCFSSYAAVNDSMTLLGHVCKVTAYWYFTRAGYLLAVRQPLEAVGDLAEALQATLNPSLICDPDGRVRWVNRAFEASTGYRSDELVGRSIGELSASGAPGGEQTLAAIRRGTPWQGQVLTRKRDGSTFLDDRSVTPIRNPQGHVTSFVIVGDDVTERTRAAQQAAENAERLRVLLEAAPDGVLVIDERGTIQLANAAVERMFGHDHAALIGANVRLLMPPALAAEHDAHLARYARTGERHIIGLGRDVTAQRKDGSTLQVNLTIGEAVLPAGRVYIGFVRDLSDRIRAEADLAEREARYRALMDTAADGVYIVDDQGAFVAVNEAYVRLSGYSRDELLRMRVADVEGVEDAADVATHIRRVVESGREVFETWHRTKDGRLWPVEISATYWPLRTGQFFVFVRDLTQRKAAEGALRLSEERFALALRGTNDGLWDRNLLDETLYLSPRWKEMLGYADGELDNRRETWLRLLHPDDALRVQLVLGEVAGGHGPERFELEMRLRHKDGHWVHVLSRGQLVRDEDGRPARMIGTHQDLTERKLAEQAVRDSENKLRQLFELSPVGIVLCSFDGALLEFNEAYRRLTGYSSAELRQLTFWDVTPLEYLPGNRAQIDSMMRTGRFGPFEKEYIRKDGSRVPVRLNGVRLDIDGRPHIWSIVEDLTETRRVEDERQALQRRQMQSQKLEALGQLTGGVAHDFNNMLAGIMGLASLGLERHVGGGDGKLAMYLHEILRTSERGRDLVAKMLAFARTEQPAVAGQRDIGPVVAELREMLASSLPSVIALRFEIEPGLPPVRISPIDVHQIVMNLVLNARDAITGPGHIGVSVRLQALQRQRCANCDELASGPHVVIEVRDDGCGIPDEVLPKIFDPFFTTKEVGKGTGLGLPSVLGIVHKAGGHVQAESEPGAGTTIRVMLPAAAGAALPSPAPPPPGPKAAAPLRDGREPAPAPAPPGRPGGIVWVVDDDSAVLVYLTEFLQEHGYAARAFADPQVALEVLRRGHEVPLALITDQTMPRLSGLELATQVLQLHPSIGVVLCTGYSEHVDADTARAIGVRHFLRKPFDSSQLLEALVDELHAHER